MCARHAKRWRKARCCCVASPGRSRAKLIAALREIIAQAPFRRMFTPGGHQMSVAMTNCGSAGWVTDHSGYRYDGIDPEFRPALAGDAGGVLSSWRSRPPLRAALTASRRMPA